MKLTKRLQCVWEHMPTVTRVADVGTDHGYLAVALVTGHKAKEVIAIDVHRGPLASATAYIAECGLSDVIETRLGNGLTVTKPGEIEGAVLCGMGGFLMRDILDAGPERLPFYVLQPQNGYRELRQYLYAHGYHIVKESMLTDMGHRYQIWIVVRDDCRTNDWMAKWTVAWDVEPGSADPYETLAADDLRWEYGALLQQAKSTCWLDWIAQQIQEKQTIMEKRQGQPGAAAALATLQAEIDGLEGFR